MKKAALTFALFSTVLVATSFATPETNSSINSDTKYSSDIIDGQYTGGQGKRKQDFQANNNISQSNFNQSEGFRQDRQSLHMNKKID